MILNPFLDGMKDAGANVELFYTRKLKIGPCNGDMSCCSRILENAAKMIMSDENYKKGMNEMMEQMKKSMAQ